MKIITVSREFGSGGRELGKRLADELGFAYYDREILTAVAESMNMDEGYLEHMLENGGLSRIPVTFSRTLNSSTGAQGFYLLAKEHGIITQLASRGDCVIVGRGADALLKEYKPFSVFVYADMKSKIARCRSRAAENEVMSDRDWEKHIKEIDKARARNYSFISATSWGDEHNYSLCVNTSGITDIKSIVPQVAAFARCTFERNSL